jgi:hypothetical protein
LEKNSSDSGDPSDEEPGPGPIKGAHSGALSSLGRRVVEAAASPETTVGVGSTNKKRRGRRPKNIQTIVGDAETDAAGITGPGK